MRRLKNSILTYLVIILLFLVGVYELKMVYAEGLGTSVKLTTIIQDWAPTYPLEFSCGTGPTGLEPTITVRTDDGIVEQGISCSDGVDISAIDDVDVGDTVYIDEVYEFANYQTTGVENDQYTITPGIVDNASGISNSDVDDYVFDNYSPSNVTVNVYKVNVVDQNGVPTGATRVREAYIMNGQEKAAGVSVGTVRIPSFCVNFSMLVKGSIADPSGTFTVTGNQIGTFTGSNRGNHRVCVNNSNEPLSYGELPSYSSITQVTYTGVNRQNEYTVTHSTGTLEEESSGLFVQNVNITATLDSGSSQTGVFYTVIPFVILVGFMGVAFIVLKKNKIKDIDQKDE